MVEFNYFNVLIVINVILLFVFYRLHVFFSRAGLPNFLTQAIRSSLNLIKGVSLVVGATNDRSVNIYFRGENVPIRPNPNSHEIPLQYDPKNLFHTWKGIPVIFAFQGSLSNPNPLEYGNNDIELTQMAQANEVYVQAEVDRRISKQNPFKDIRKLQIVSLAAVIIGFVVLYFVLNDFTSMVETFINQFNTTFEEYRPTIETILENQRAEINENLGPGVEEI